MSLVDGKISCWQKGKTHLVCMGLQEQFWYFMFEQNNIGDGIISDMTN